MAYTIDVSQPYRTTPYSTKYVAVAQPYEESAYHLWWYFAILLGFSVIFIIAAIGVAKRPTYVYHGFTPWLMLSALILIVIAAKLLIMQ